MYVLRKKSCLEEAKVLSKSCLDVLMPRLGLVSPRDYCLRPNAMALASACSCIFCLALACNIKDSKINTIQHHYQNHLFILFYICVSYLSAAGSICSRHCLKLKKKRNVVLFCTLYLVIIGTKLTAVPRSRAICLCLALPCLNLVLSCSALPSTIVPQSRPRKNHFTHFTTLATHYTSMYVLRSSH